MSFSNYLENALLNHLFGKSTFSAPANIYVALSTADPGEDGAGLAEPSGNAYARVQTAPADWNTAASGAIDNANVIQFPTPTGAWGTVTHFALFDAASGGNLLGSAALSQSEVIASGNDVDFPAGSLDVTLD